MVEDNKEKEYNDDDEESLTKYSFSKRWDTNEKQYIEFWTKHYFVGKGTIDHATKMIEPILKWWQAIMCNDILKNDGWLTLVKTNMQLKKIVK